MPIEFLVLWLRHPNIIFQIAVTHFSSSRLRYLELTIQFVSSTPSRYLYFWIDLRSVPFSHVYRVIFSTFQFRSSDRHLMILEFICCSVVPQLCYLCLLIVFFPFVAHFPLFYVCLCRSSYDSYTFHSPDPAHHHSSCVFRSFCWFFLIVSSFQIVATQLISKVSCPECICGRVAEIVSSKESSIGSCCRHSGDWSCTINLDFIVLTYLFRESSLCRCSSSRFLTFTFIKWDGWLFTLAQRPSFPSFVIFSFRHAVIDWPATIVSYNG